VNKLNKYNIAIIFIIIGAVLFVLGFLLGYYPSSIIGILIDFLGIIAFIYDYFNKRNQKQKDMQFLKNQRKMVSLQEKTKQEVERVESIVLEEFKSHKILERIRSSLSGTVSTEELVNEFDHPLYALMMYKWGEPDDKLIRNKLFELGFVDISSGIKILPPSRMPYPPLKTKQHVEKWIRQNILDLLPSDYKYSIVFAQLVDLRKTYVEKYAPKEWAQRFRGFTLFDKLTWDELFSPDFLYKSLTKKFHVSIEELIVEYFPFSFLISKYLNEKEKRIILPQTKKINKELEQTFGLSKIKLHDFASMDIVKLTEVLEKIGLSEPKEVAQNIVNEANQWKIFLEKL
jgi:hypothetical protein